MADGSRASQSLASYFFLLSALLAGCADSTAPAADALSREQRTAAVDVIVESERVLPARFRGAAINDRGVVAGVYAPPGAVVTRAAIVAPDGHLVDIGSFAGLPTMVVQGINNSDQIVGYGVGDGGPPRGFMWSAPTGFVALADVTSASSNPFAIDDEGNIVGDVDLPSGEELATYRPAGGVWEPVPHLRHAGEPPILANAYAISVTGEVVGIARLTETDPFDGYNIDAGYVWKVGQRWARRLPGLGGRRTVPMAISPNGTFIAGSALPAGSETDHPVVWLGRARKVVDLGTLGLPDDAGRASIATGVNDAGQVVGSTWTPDMEQHAFVWTEAAGLRDIGTPGAFTHAFAINNRGQVLGVRESRALTQSVVWTLATSGGRPE